VYEDQKNLAVGLNKNERLDCSIRDCGIDPDRKRRSVAFAQWCDILLHMWRPNTAPWRLFDVR